MPYVVLIVACLASGCAPRCRVETVPVRWDDGSLSSWTVTVCRSGR